MNQSFLRIRPCTTASPSPAFRGRRFTGLTSLALLVGLSTAAAQQTQSTDPADTPYGPVRHDPHPATQHDPYFPRGNSEAPLRRAPRGLRLQPGTSVLLTFGQDRYQDGAALAAMVHGLETGERLLVERTENGVLLRRHAGPPVRGYDFLEPASGSSGDRP